MEQYIDRLTARMERPEIEYVGKDGLLHCAKCHDAVQLDVMFLDIPKRVRCVCSCIKKKNAEIEAEQKRQELDRKRRYCFAETNMASWTFANDDGKNPKLSEAMRKYVKNFTDFKKEGKGLLLHGTVGTGKTYLAACIANALIDEGISVMMTNFARLTNTIQSMFDGRQEYIDSLNDFSLLIIDDLGAERKSEFMQEMVFNIIDARYRAGLPLIITTNLTTEEIKKPQDVGYSRIYDRILERCHPVEVSGISRRRQNVKDSYFETQEKLGL